MTGRKAARIALLAAGAIAGAAGLAAWKTSAAPAEGQISILSARIAQFGPEGAGDRFGDLQFVGGLHLSSRAEGFGGFSGLRLRNGRLLAITDRCTLLSAPLERDGDGTPAAMSRGWMSALPPGRSGKALSRQGFRDCEAIEIAGDEVWLSFETANRILRFTLRDDRQLAAPRDVTPNGREISFSRNAGLEALARFPASSPRAGMLLAIAEASFDGAGNHVGWYGAPGGERFDFTVRHSDDFSVTDADFLPDGDLVLLERRFGFSVEPGFRIRRFAASDIVPGAVLEGETVFVAGLQHRIDNMEGLDAWQDDQGRTRLTLISDDNFLFLQSTILLEFILVDRK